MPALTTVGYFSILSSSNSFDCSSFNNYRQINIIQGFYSCQEETIDKTNGSSTGDVNAPNNTTASDLPSPKATISGGAIGGIVMGILAVIFVIGAFLFLRRRKSANNKTENDGAAVIGVDGKAEMGSGEVKKSEMPANGHEVHEVEGQHGVSEVIAGGKDGKWGEPDVAYELAGSEPVVLSKEGQIKRKPVL